MNNNVTQITKASRLTEQEVHEAAQNLIDNEEIVTSLTLLKALGRGSLTTITKYLSTFNKENSESEYPSNPAFTELPETLNRSTKLLAIKIWTESQAIANKELESQRDALQHTAKQGAERIKEAEEFSDEQAKRIEELEKIYQEGTDELNNMISSLTSELEIKTNEFNELVIKFEVLKNEHTSVTSNLEKAEKQIDDIKVANELHVTELKSSHQTNLNELEKSLTTITSDKDQYQVKKAAAEQENIRLDLQVSKQQIGMDVLIKRIDEEKQLKAAEIKENKALREKASMLEGELKAWKAFKPESSAEK